MSEQLHPHRTAAEQPGAAERGVPSLVWRAGQERRLSMLNAAAPLAGKTVLVDGCGIGMYVRAIGRFTPRVYGIDIEVDRVAEGAQMGIGGMMGGVCEHLPYADQSFDVVFSHEVLEHVQDDRLACREMARVLRPGGRAVIFVPNRLYFFETHGVYVRGEYHFGNIPLVNWLPSALRNRLAPHVRAYTAAGLRGLFDGTPMRVVSHTQVYPGFDNIVARSGGRGRALRAAMQGLESSPLRVFGLSHLLVVQKQN
ncbi:MAG TPA: class I SAM-dependent methyltransferase [Thermoflexales bacterium]|nr:class I SAM-dependent methyltransferase [Thermoflexales bacterium]HQW36615.1 class I SAM-dependent methyltransferase [Thermoflexales bacterium]HQX76358.1 class I SAM-dependent methyltransferase [Thermoflexales bacterium]HQZ99656.1 class I SAM-dependent methyltransferase [Thermoflexales bacterium]